MRRLIGLWLDGAPLLLNVDDSYKLLTPKNGFIELTLPDGARGLLNAHAIAYIRVEEIAEEVGPGA
jgi:hypothetical protein